MGQFKRHRGTIGRWYKQIAIVCIFKKTIDRVGRFEARDSRNEISGPYGRALDDAGINVNVGRYFPMEFGTVLAAIEECNNPVVNIIREGQFG